MAVGASALSAGIRRERTGDSRFTPSPATATPRTGHAPAPCNLKRPWKVVRAEDLQKKGWSRIVRVAEGDEAVSIDVAFHNGAMAGLMIMALEEKEVAIVNLVGSLNLAAILQLASRGLDPAVLDSLQKAVQQATGSK